MPGPSPWAISVAPAMGSVVDAIRVREAPLPPIGSPGATCPRSAVVRAGSLWYGCGPMAKSRQAGTSFVWPQALYQQLLLFPERAEYLVQARFRRYQIHLDHWRDLSREFRLAFEAVYVRKSARILLVHGLQGTGKSLFVRKVEDDFQAIARGSTLDERENLWLVLAGGAPADRAIGEQAARTTALRRLDAQEIQSGWLTAERNFARKDESEMRVFLIDDVHKDIFMSEWAGLQQGEYIRFRTEGHVGVVLESVAQRLVEDCRGAFQRSLFVLLSHDESLLETLHRHLERSHAGLAPPVLHLPLPKPAIKEKIVRTNTNRLNGSSYWYCLDRGGPEEKRLAYETMQGDRGFIDSFQAINRALAESPPRPGRPANKNLLTFVTLGADPLMVQSWIDNRELSPDEDKKGTHVGSWLFRQKWASALVTADQEYTRRAELLESEFTLRWVALDLRVLWWLTTAAADDEHCESIVSAISASPSIGDKQSVKDEASRRIDEIDDAMTKLELGEGFEAYATQFRNAGQLRSREYEDVLARRFARPFSRGLAALGSIRPDLTLAEYEPCAVTTATSSDPKAIEAAIRRECHVIEFTAHLQQDLRGLDDYLRDKVDVYATLLESV
jgi:hypothetical protein